MRDIESSFLEYTEGILYNSENDECRTPGKNVVVQCMAEQAGGAENESGNNTFDCTIPAFGSPEGNYI